MYANKRAHSICFYPSLIIGPRKLHCRASRSFRKDHSSREDRTATHVRTGQSPALVQQKSSFGLRGNGILAFYRKREPVCQLRKSLICRVQHRVSGVVVSDGTGSFGKKKALRSVRVIALPKTFLSRFTISSGSRAAG